MGPEAQCHGIKTNLTWYLWSKYEAFVTSQCQDMDFMENWHIQGNRSGTGTRTIEVTVLAARGAT